MIQNTMLCPADDMTGPSGLPPDAEALRAYVDRQLRAEAGDLARHVLELEVALGRFPEVLADRRVQDRLQALRIDATDVDLLDALETGRTSLTPWRREG